MKVYRHPISGKEIGALDDHTYRRTVPSTRSFLKTPQAIAIEKWIIDDLGKNGCQEIVIHEEKEGIDYKSSYQEFINNCALIHFMNQDELLYLPIAYWNDNETKQLSLLGD